MRIGVISDIHGNLVALDSVLTELNNQKVDMIVCVGDVAATGPRPHEVLSRLRSMNIPTVKGNRDEYLLNIGGHDLQKISGDDYASRVEEIDHWCRTKLTQEDIEYIRSFPDTIVIPLASNSNESIFCFHGSPKSNTDSITSSTTESELDLKLTGHKNRVMTCGHSHVQMFRRHGEVSILNPGSVGQAIEYHGGSSRARRVSRSEYGLIECDQSGVIQRAELLRSELQPSKVLRDAIDSGMPHAEWWAERK